MSKSERKNPADLPYTGDIIDERKGRKPGSIDTGDKVDDREAYEANFEEWLRKKRKQKQDNEGRG